MALSALLVGCTGTSEAGRPTGPTDALGVVGPFEVHSLHPANGGALSSVMAAVLHDASSLAVAADSARLVRYHGRTGGPGTAAPSE